MAFPVTLNGRTYTLTDFEGTNYVDGLPDAFEDFVTHAGDIYNSTSTTSNSIGTGSKTFTVEASKPYQVGTPLRIADTAAVSTNWIDGIVTAYSGTTLTVDAVAYAGSGTKTAWSINIGGGPIAYTGTLPIAQGGTGATTAAAAQTNLDVYSKADADSRFLNVSGEASDVTMTGNVTIGDAAGDTLTVNATPDFNTGINVDGTVTADGLTVDTSTGAILNGTGTGAVHSATRGTAATGGSRSVFVFNAETTGDAADNFGPALQFNISDTGVDNSELGAIGFVRNGGDGAGKFAISQGGNNLGSSPQFTVAANGDISFYEDTGTTAKFFWDASAESLGIGNTNPDAIIRADSGTANKTLFKHNPPSSRYFSIADSSDGTYDNAITTFYKDATVGQFVFETAAAERMRIDSSGNLLVGKTYNDNGVTEGIEIEAGGQLNVTVDGSFSRFNRLTSDGDIISFRKDGEAVGSIGVNGGRLFINGDNGSSGGGLKFTATDARPVDRNGSDWDNNFDMGDGGVRFDDIYATNGTIQTSDRNEKQDIAELSDAEQRVAVAAKGLMRKFRWRDAVEAKGDEARTHFGIIAQDLQAAFAAEGLDAGDYAMFISSTWTDEETGEERTRMGVRYSELLAFIIAAI